MGTCVTYQIHVRERVAFYASTRARVSVTRAARVCVCGRVPFCELILRARDASRARAYVRACLCVRVRMPFYERIVRARDASRARLSARVCVCVCARAPFCELIVRWGERVARVRPSARVCVYVCARLFERASRARL